MTRRALAAPLLLALAVAGPALAQPAGAPLGAPREAGAGHDDDEGDEAVARRHGGHAERHGDLAHVEAHLEPRAAARARAAVAFARRHLTTSDVDRNLRVARLLAEGPVHAPATDVLAALLEGTPREAARARFGADVAAALAAASPARAVAARVEALRRAAAPLDATVSATERALLVEDARVGLLAGLRREGDPRLARALERELDRAATILRGPDLAVERSVAEVLALARGRLAPADVATLSAAIDVARASHAGQARDGGEPALLHALRVTAGLLTRRGPVEAAAVHAAVLHDVVEDTRTPLAELRARFGPRVAELVNDVTLDPLERFGGDKAARDRAYYARFARASEGAHLIKLYDRIDNINDMRGWPPDGQLGYLKRTRETVLASLAARDPALARELLAEIERLERRVERELGRCPTEATLARFRRADGTLRWAELAAERARAEGAALGHFTLALFLKELAVVVRTGDRLRIDEFFEGLLSTDFFVHYGVFTLGARAGELAYARSLQRVLRPTFVAGLLKSQVALATGLLAGELAAGTLSGEHFAISLASLGLSTTAVRAGVTGLTWVRDLAYARRAAAGRAVVTAGRLAMATGWVYAVAETTVVLYAAEALEARLRAVVDERRARAELAAANRALLDAAARARRGALDAAGLARALAAHAAAWDRWRDHLLGALAAEDARLHARLQEQARRAKVLADERAAALAGLEAQPALAARLVARHGSLEAWADARAAEDEAALQRDVDLALAAHARARDAVLRAAYAEGARGAPLLAGVEAAAWHARGGVTGDAGDPWAGRRDLFARWGRDRSRAAFDAALGGASRNRLEAWDDERALLDLVAGTLAGRPDLAALVRDEAARLGRARTIDARAYAAATAAAPVRGVVDHLPDGR